MTDLNFKDYFSRQSATYAQHRPRYPEALFVFLAQQVETRTRAWDAGCGNGQASCGLAPFFEQVVATDPSQAQLEQAAAPENVRFLQAAETCAALSDASVDLVTVAQAIHWFDRPRFYEEVRRVLHPGGWVACWTYDLPRLESGVDALLDRFYHDQVGAFWNAERRLVETGYATLDFPFREVQAPLFEIRTRWRLDHLLGYLRSWSATRHFMDACGVDPVVAYEAEFSRVWGSPETEREGRWPVHLRLGQP